MFVRVSCLLLAFAASALSQTLTNDTVERFEFIEPHLGTTVRLVFYAPNASAAQQAASNAFARVRALDAVLSDYKDDSEVRRLGRSPESMVVGPDLWSVLSASREVSRDSGGAFDVTVGPLVMMWRQARISGRLPPQAVRDKRLAVVGWEKLKLEQSREQAARGIGTVTPVPRTRLDLGGIAKGYIADQVLASLVADGCPRAMVDAGGDLALGMAPPERAGWRVVVERPGGDQGTATEPLPQGAVASLLNLSSCGVASSGSRYQFLELGGQRYSHIVDPRTGLGTTHGWQVTVVAPEAMSADAWASAFSVLGPDGSARLKTIPDSVKPRWLRPATAEPATEKP